MTARSGIILALFLFAAGLPSFVVAAEPEPVPASDEPIVAIDGVAAIVNDEVITQTELDEELDRVRAQLRQKALPIPASADLDKQVLEELIVSRLQLQLAQTNGITVDDETLDKAIANIAEMNNLSLARFKEVLANDGFDFKKFRERIRKEILIRRLHQQQIDSQILITDQEVDAFLNDLRRQGVASDEYDVAHILIPVSEAAGADERQTAEKKAEDIHARLDKGADFAELAISSSGGEQALEGGDLGWRKLGELPTLFADQVIDMNPGDVSAILRSSRGFHIIKLLGHRAGEKHMVKQTLARHILIRPNALADELQTKEKLMEIRQQILDKKLDFETAARTLSEDKASAAQGGDLGWVDPGIMVPEFEDAMNELKKGEISEPVKSGFGWHLIQVLDRREVDNTAEFNRTQAREQLTRRESDNRYSSWLHQLRSEAYVDIRLGKNHS
ncbi:MAG: molecular chaperone SurA [Gammaproteobacteria bacterium]|nr:molecular chaperone SurA [Gammaproteobacteria bacterium]